MMSGMYGTDTDKNIEDIVVILIRKSESKMIRPPISKPEVDQSP